MLLFFYPTIHTATRVYVKIFIHKELLTVFFVQKYDHSNISVFVSEQTVCSQPFPKIVSVFSAIFVVSSKCFYFRYNHQSPTDVTFILLSFSHFGFGVNFQHFFVAFPTVNCETV